MQLYLFATNLLALTAFLLGLSNFSKGVHAWRLVPLFLLVVSQSTSLIINLAGLSSGLPSETAAQSVLALGVFSTFCAVWALIDFINLSKLWRRLAWLGGGLSLLLCIWPLIPGWPVPSQLHSLVISVVGSLLVLRSLPRFNGLHLSTPLLLVVANFIGLLGYDNVFWLLAAVAYVLLVSALHWEGLDKLQQQQHRSELLAQQAASRSGQHQRYVEVSQIISRATSVDDIGSHIVRSLASVTHADQAAIVCLEPGFSSKAYVAAVFGARQAADLPLADFDLIDCPPLHLALERGQSLLLSPWETVDLESLYQLWAERDEGPTLIQPLSLQGRSIGALILGNPVSDRPLQADDQALCRSLAAQIAILVEAYRRRRESARPAEVATLPKVERRAEVRPELERASMAEATDYASLLGTTVASRLPFRALPLAAEAKPALEQPEIQPENYLTLVNALTEGVVVSNVSGRVWLANAAAERILGQSQADLLDRPIGTIYGKIDSSGAIEELVADFSRRDDPLLTLYDDGERSIRGQLIPWRNASHEWLGMVAIFHDITHDVRANQATNNFMSALSRVLRNPLAIIKGYSELSITGALESYSPEQVRVQQIINNSVDRVVEVLDNFIQISRQTPRRVALKLEEIKIAPLVDDVLAEIVPLAELKQIKLTREIKASLPSLTADRSHIRRILENLLVNACRFSLPGGRVTVRAWMQEEVATHTVRPYMVLTVTDFGQGIPSAELKRIFDPFYRLENEGPGEPKGIGMGLAVVKELVEAHRGRVWVESRVGEGATFFVALPLSPGV